MSAAERALGRLWDTLRTYEAEARRAAEEGSYQDAATSRAQAVGVREAIEVLAEEANRATCECGSVAAEDECNDDCRASR